MQLIDAGIVYEQHLYVYSSAAQYAAKEIGLLPIKFLYWKMKLIIAKAQVANAAKLCYGVGLVWGLN